MQVGHDDDDDSNSLVNTGKSSSCWGQQDLLPYLWATNAPDMCQTVDSWFGDGPERNMDLGHPTARSIYKDDQVEIRRLVES